MTRSAQSAAPVPWQRGYTGPKGSTVVLGWTKELKAGGTDDVAVYNDIFIPGLHVLNVPINTLLKSKIYVYISYEHFILQPA